VKGSPQSPPGKGRARERSRRSGKGERGHHQLYRLSITGARPNPTIGIAYPQQKVTPPKKPEANHGPMAGSYRFHVPSIPQREAELRQEDLGFGRCFPDATTGRTSANYTSQPAPRHGPKGQPPAAGIPLKSPGTNGQLHYLEFQANGADAWPSPEKSFAGASYGVSVQKPSSFPEGGKASAHGLGALPCQYPFQLLHDSGKEPYRSDAASQEEWQEEGLSGGSYESVSPEGRLYGLPAPPPPPLPPFLHPPPPLPALHHGPLPCCKGRSEHPADPNGALSSSGAIDQNPSTFQENQAVFPSSLHSSSMPKPVGKRQASAKDSVPSPRLLVQSSPLRRNMPPNSLSQVHFPSKAYCSSPAGSASAGSVPFETSIPTTAPTHPRLVQAWEGATKAFSPMDQNSAPYSNPVGNQFSFECQSGPEQRQHRQKNARMPWQQIHLTSAMPGQNRLELSRQITSQKLPFPLGTSEWQGSGKAQKGPPISNSPGYHGKKLLTGESLGVQRGDPNSTGAFSFESGKEPGSPACDSRSKALFYSMGPPPPPPSRSSSGSALVLPPSALVAASPCESPLPSPVPNPTCGSTCSSLSPMSSSPLNPGFEDSQMSGALAPSPFFQHPCHPKDSNKTFHPSDVLSSGSLHYHPPDSVKAFHFPPDALKDDNLLKCAPASPFHKPGVEMAKGCSDGLDGEQPPPPYSSHHLLASSLSSASLDQLDVLLTCKQCDQNYSNLSSFLQHRQFCASHPAPQGEGKDAPRAAEGRKALPPEPPKPPSLGLSPDPQAHLLVLNKSDDFLLDGESKSEGKEDALKGGLFNGLATSSLPLTASDLDIDDAKLDSLITEALNGLGYQSDNPEIDSSFIDVFADEELTGVKAASGGMSHKAKEALASESKSKQAAAEEKAAGQPKASYLYEDGHPGGEQVKRGAGKQHLHKGRVARRLAAQDPDPGAGGAERTARLRAGRKNSVPPATTSSKSTSSQKHPRKLSQEPPAKSEVGPGVATKTPKPPRFSMKDMKKRKPRSGTWSKELIHKIVQQKNKLHKLQVKSSKQAHFSKKRPGRSERAKEKDPAWSYSRKRDGQKREAQEHRGVPRQEDAEKEDCPARVRRRSSQSSTGSNHSRSVPGETGTSPPCADGAGSGCEKGGTQRRRRSGSPAHVPRTPLSLPEDRSPKKSQKSKEDFSRGSRRFGSAKPLLAGSRTRPSTEPDVAATDCAKEEPLPQPQERQLPSMAASGRSPVGLSCKEGAEEPKGAAKHTGEAGEPSLEAQDSAELTMVNQRHQFAPFTSDGLKYHAEELIAPSHGGNEASPGNVSAAYSEAGIKYLKAHGLCDGRKDYPTPVAPYGGDAVGMMLTTKAPDPYVSSDNAFFDPKGLPGHYDDNIFSKPPALGSSHMDDMYLCRDDINTSSFEQKHASISPYAAETPQGKVSSPLSFDSSSIFGELPVTEFDPPLYESVSASKDGYVTTFACSGNPSSKPLPFEQPYPPFMPEKDWSLMDEVAPMLPEDMTQFHNLSVEKPLAKKFPEEGPVPTSQLSLPLPDRITDYNVTFMNNISDDELEIKRLVTELESELQTSKLDNEASDALQKPEQDVTAHLQGQAAEQFPPLPVEQETGQEKGLFLADELGSSSLCVGERLEGEKPAVESSRGDYERPREPWPCPVELGSLEAGVCTPAPLTTDRFCSKDSGEQLQGAVAAKESDPGKTENGSSSKSLPGSHTPDQTQAPIYTDPVTKSSPVVTMFPKTLEAAEATKDPLPSLPCQRSAESFPVPGKGDESFVDAAELEKFDAHLPNRKPEFGFQQGRAPALDLAFSPHIKEVPDTDERPESPKMAKSAVDFKGDGGGSALMEETEARKSPTTYPAPRPGDKASKQKVLLFDMLSLPKESNCGSQKMLASQETAANPLQQLQLFVARTVKSNEEELLMPCFPMLLAPSHPSAIARVQPEQKEDSGGALEGENRTYCTAQGEGKVPVGGNVENIAAPAKEAVLFASACEQLESFGAMGSYRAKQSTFAKPELQNNVTELQHLANEHAEPTDINICADGVSQERNDLSPLKNTAVTPLPGQGKKADQLMEEQEQDKNKATLAFKKHEQSHLSRSLLEKETLSSAAAERLERNQEGQGAQPLRSASASPTSPPGPSEEDLHQDHHLVPETKAAAVSAKVPREGNGKKKSLNGCHYTGESLASLPLPTNFPHPKCLQSGGAEGGEVCSFSTQKLHGKDCSLPCSPPFNQEGVGKEVPENAGAVLSSSHFQENQARTITDMVVNSIPPETQDYPTQPTTDLLPIREREVNLNQVNKLESCSDDRNKHQSEPEALSNAFVVQQGPAAVSRGLTRIGDLGPAELNGHEFSEAAEVRLGLSKTTESGGNSLKGEKPKSHGAGEAGSCVLNSMGQGEGNTPNSTPNPSQNELHKEKKPNGLPVTCDICSATFRSKPGLTRHKAVKHQVKNGGMPQPSKTPRSTFIPADKTSKAAQKVPRRSLKTSVKDKTCSSQMPTTNIEHVPKRICPDLEKDPSMQMQEVVSRVLSDLSVISFEMSQELHRTRVLQREMKAKGPRLETRGAGEAAAGKLDSGRQARKGEKGRKSQSKDPGEVNGNSEKKLSRKVRRRKAKVFPSRNEPDGPCELEKNAGPPSAVLSSGLPRIMEGLHEPGGCISTEEQNRSNSTQHSQKAKQSPCAAELAEDLGDRIVSSKEMVSKESVTGTVACPGEVEDPNGVEDTQACKKWVSRFVKQVEKGLGKVGKEQHRGADGTEEMDAETGDSPAAGSSTGNRSSAPQGPMAPTEEGLPLETCDSETTQKAPGQGALQTVPGTSPPPAEPKRWAKADVPLGREHCVESTAVSDLQSLFDDDSTFSQLFPRDDQFIRRKCTRVYGKRSKKPKPVTEVNLQPAGAIDLFTIRLASDLSETSSFCVTREDPCEYETISVDDALMLNMCHSSKAKSGDAPPSGSKSIAPRSDCEKTDQGKEDIDLEDNMLTFLCQNSQVDNVPSLNIWGSLEKEGESLSAEDMFEPLMDLEDEHSLREASSEPPDLAEEPYNGKANEDSDSPEFHTIDIEMLNAKLKMRDMCFFGPCEDLPGHGEDNAVSFKPKPGQHSKHRSKLEDGKLGKNRSEITIKAKDKQYKCKVCFQWFLTLGELDFHKLSHNPSPPPTCYMCVQRKFSSREQLRDHLKEKHAKNKAGLWACGMCLKEISDVWMYNEHLREHATQFARKGQAQKSVMGLPACFGEDNAAVTHFLNTIMYRKPSRSSRHADPSSKHAVSRESKSPKELPLEQEAKAMKDPLESNVKAKPPAPSSSKASASPSPEHMAKSEGTPKSVPMHPDCKDPSRDCHHCGKQFPKPFKLQRHLVVHSLQKIYLCHKCPMFYQETKELRNHLSQEHGIVEEQEIKHTTLYACELCADVMHVIKKSFICSMCNYTFSKKEQYDRHMEKHLVGSNKTFKFRGVMRPGVASREGREKVKEDCSLREGMPPSKKRKVAHHGSSLPRSSPVHLDHASDLQLVEAASPSLQAPTDSFPTAPGDPGAPLTQPSMKTEDLVGDFSDLLVEMEKSQFDNLPPPPCLSPSLPQAAASSPELGHIAALSIEELEKGAFDGKPLPFLDSPDVGNKDEYIAGALENPGAATDAVDGIPFLQLAKKVSELPSPQAEVPPAKETHRWGNPSASDACSWEGASKTTCPEAAHHPLPLKDKTASPTLYRAAKDSTLQKKTAGSHPGSEVAPGAGSPGGSTEEGQQPISGKEKAVPEAKDSSANAKDQGSNPSKSTGHQPRAEAASNAVRHGHVEPSKAAGKLHPKRRKEHKSLSHRSSSGSRENMEGDGKKKKARTPCPGRSESASELKRAGWSNTDASALSPGRRETHCNRLVPKPKTGTQLKKMVLDTYNQKKGELRHANGDVKRRKAILGKSLHQVLAKGPAPSLRGSLHSPRAARGAKPAGSASYRTAESQNNLLSQLFGQKLTSFKIPLRRDTSE
ncbi:ZN469 protein, partial [Ciconia maguari]|nr:ZN469 protein [Ciconia maguari]